MRNITIDDTDPAIRYEPPGAWMPRYTSTLDYNGTNEITENSTATATFSFTGVAIYYIAPLWPYVFHAQITLDTDSTTSTLVDLQDHGSTDAAGQGPPSVNYSVRWSAVNLSNTKHTLVISVGEGKTISVVDGLIYTVLESTSTGNIPTSTSIASSSSSSTLSASPSTSSETHSITPIIIGSVLGSLSAFVIVGVTIWLLRRHRRKSNNAKETSPNSPHSNGENMFVPNALLDASTGYGRISPFIPDSDIGTPAQKSGMTEAASSLPRPGTKGRIQFASTSNTTMTTLAPYSGRDINEYSTPLNHRGYVYSSELRHEGTEEGPPPSYS